MSLIRHIFIALAYSLIAVAAAMAAPRLWPPVGPELGVMIGGVVFVGCALLHEAHTRQDQFGALADEIVELRQYLADPASGRFPVGGDAIAAGGAADGIVELQPVRAIEQDVDDVVAEVRVLQRLVEQLSQGGGQAGGSVSRAASYPAPRAASDLALRAASASAAPAKATAAKRAVEPRPAVPVAEDLDDRAVLDIVREALRGDRVNLVFQPIVSLPQRKKQFYEAFTRIQGEDGSMILPEQYIALAEGEGLITAIDNMLLFKCVQLVRKARARNREVGFFCNISPHTLADRRFLQEFVEFMSENRELAQSLIFEFHQSLVDNRDDDIDRQLSRLAVMGFRFSMDQVLDPRVDYAALADRHFKYVKVDAGVLISKQEKDGHGDDVRTLKRLLDSHGIDLIAGKIESESVLREILDLNIDFGQGYLFGEPRESKA